MTNARHHDHKAVILETWEKKATTQSPYPIEVLQTFAAVTEQTKNETLSTSNMQGDWRAWLVDCAVQ